MIQLDDKGLVPAIAQDATSGQVLMLGYVSPGSLRRTLEGGDVWFYSRSREELWHKGEISGNYLHVESAWLDCDGDAVLLKVHPDGPACHTGSTTCFFTPLKELPEFAGTNAGPGILAQIFAVIQDRKEAMPEGSYTTRLFSEGVDRISQKVIEEAGETALAGARGDREAVVGELADLLYHALVLLAATGATPDDVWQELRERRT